MSGKIKITQFMGMAGMAVAMSALPMLAYAAQNVSAAQPSSVPWYITRASAITAYLLMFAVTVLGTGMTNGFVYKILNPVRSWTTHKYVSIAMFAAIAVHGISLLFDKFVQFGIREILVPFVSSYQPVFVGLGIVAFYLVVATILISLLLRIRLPRFWRVTHYAAYPLFIFSFVHGVYSGTDSGTPFMKFVYWMTGGIFILLVMIRIWGYAGVRREKHTFETLKTRV